ncbi:MAG: ATP-dependent ligase LigD polymerase module / ATP-dependent ligase LigD phosphoesterase [Rhodospirillales bacterium]|nr:ATP-dependent ligase LigD polymerase module / ATP-dependent ligase LigD phosphoesterase [Rhodospirillales bacterium]
MASRKLRTYRDKRDFSKTAEPSGAARVVPARQLRFVIQKHDATRLHYDLRLEYDGVFKSWAVTRGPSLDPGEKRLAVEVEDHPLDYGDFEGTIPKGQYGGGTVEIWDRGYWYAEDPAKGLAKGDLKFALMGEKLQGEWVLVRMKHDRSGGKRTNWLLIKHRDDYAKPGSGEDVLEKDRSVASGRTLEQIAKGKGKAPEPFMMTRRIAGSDAVWDSNKGAAAEARARESKRSAKPSATPASTGKKAPKKARVQIAKARAIKGGMPDFAGLQLCKTATRPPSAEGWVHEIKFDGYRIQMRIASDDVTLKTRKGLDWTDKFSAIAKAAAKLPDAILDGEIVALNAKGDPDFSAMQAALSEGKTDALVYFAFDLPFAEGEDLRPLPLLTRKDRLRKLLGRSARSDRAPIRYVEHFDVNGEQMLATARESGLEGIISKRIDAPYRAGRGGNWVKTKSRPGHEVVIGGWKTTGGKFRSLMAGVNNSDHLVYTGIVGTGYGRDTVKRIMPALKAAAASKSPFTGKNAPAGGRNVHWLKPELVAEIEFAGWTDDGMVRQAAFKGLRADKPAREVRVEMPARPAAPRFNKARLDKTKLNTTQPNARATPAVNTGTTRSRQPRTSAARDRSTVMRVVISHPDKALWPDAGDRQPVTKRDLAAYMEAVGGWMIGHIRGRPCSIVRAPDGIDGETFFQRHAMPGLSDLVTQAKVSGDRKPYLQIDRIEALAAVAQIGGIELHPWNCAPNEYTVPGRLVFDLDPAPGIAFPDVIAAAKDMKQRLEALGLETFCKTTGGKGLHVVTPLAIKQKDGLNWKQAKMFAQAVCEQMAADAPDKYLINMSKKQREGKIFLDYLRNDTKSTAVAPLSPRARPSATVSMPLNWSQVKAGLDPKRFTLRTAPDLLKKSKAWADYDKAARPLTPAISRLVR